MARQISIALVFLVGCAVGGVGSQLVAPPASAGSDGPRWEYFCFKAFNEPSGPVEVLNANGKRGWELAAVNSSTSSNNESLYCMKRALQ